jgi:hypothetical protein
LLDVWERDVLARSFESGSDINGDGFISWSEWKNNIKARACALAEYAPHVMYDLKSPPTTIRGDGIDPRIFEEGMFPESPMFLTPAGQAKYKAGTLKFPVTRSGSAVYTQTTETLCAAAESQIMALTNAKTVGDALSVADSGDPIAIRRVLEHLALNLGSNYEYGSPVRDFLVKTILNDKLPESVRMLALRRISLSEPAATPPVEVLMVELVHRFGELSDQLQKEALYLFGRFKTSEARPVLEHVRISSEDREAIMLAEESLRQLDTK